LMRDSLNLSDISTRANTDLFNKVRLNIGIVQSPYDRDSTGQRVDVFLKDTGKNWLRLSRANAAIGSNFQGGENTEFPWNVRVDYNLDVRNQWMVQNQQDSLVMTQSVRARGGVELFDRWRIDVNTGYDFMREEMTTTQLDVYWDLHCWELAVNWVPFGLRQSFYVRLNIKASMLKDLKVEYRKYSEQGFF